jgi:hypothetical protein
MKSLKAYSELTDDDREKAVSAVMDTAETGEHMLLPAVLLKHKIISIKDGIGWVLWYAKVTMALKARDDKDLEQQSPSKQ